MGRKIQEREIDENLEQAERFHRLGFSAKLILQQTGVDASHWNPTPWDVVHHGEGWKEVTYKKG